MKMNLVHLFSFPFFSITLAIIFLSFSSSMSQLWKYTKTSKIRKAKAMCPQSLLQWRSQPPTSAYLWQNLRGRLGVRVGGISQQTRGRIQLISNGRLLAGDVESRVTYVMGHECIFSFFWQVPTWEQGEKLGKLSFINQILVIWGSLSQRLLLNFLYGYYQ